jgi:hypothetical protein
MRQDDFCARGVVRLAAVASDRGISEFVHRWKKYKFSSSDFDLHMLSSIFTIFQYIKYSCVIDDGCKRQKILFLQHGIYSDFK